MERRLKERRGRKKEDLGKSNTQGSEGKALERIIYRNSHNKYMVKRKERGGDK